MKFKELNEQDIQYLKFVYYEDMAHAEKMEILTKKFGASERSIRRWWKERLELSEHFSKLPHQLREAQKRQINGNTDILLVTSAQNTTGVNSKFLKSLETYQGYLEGRGHKTEIVVMPQRYRNPTNPVEDDKKKQEMWWVDEVVPYLHYGKIQFGDVLISSKSRIRPTAKEPLMGYEVLAKDNSLVLPHPRVHFKTMPRFKNGPLRSMSTTGYITVKNYSDSKAGETAWEHHAYGFVIVEKKKDGTCHIPRNVKVKSDGSFIDLVYSVDGEVVKEIDSCPGMVLGDIHASEIDEDIFEETLKLLDLFNPKKLVLHDVFDGATVNPHEVKDMYIQKKKIRENRFLIDQEIKQSFDLIKVLKDSFDGRIYVSLSNHDVFLDRMINDGNWKKDLHNSHNYLEYALIQQTVDLEQYGTIYGYLLDKEFSGEVIYLTYADSLSIEGYECALHGDHGTNGSRGSYKQFSRLNTKMIHGHGHSPILYNNVSMVGVTCRLSQYYNQKGLSSWAHAHSTIHPNGKNQLLVFGDDKKISVLI